MRDRTEPDLDPCPQLRDVARDFDRIALLPQERWDHNSHYHSFLLRHIPQRGEAALDIGCGRGAFTRLLAQRFDQVDAIDLSPDMVRVAQSASDGFPNIRFHVADARSWLLHPSLYDCVASIATLHHMDLAEALTGVRAGLRTGGVLAVLDLYKSETVGDWLNALAAFPSSLILRMVKTGRLRTPRAKREAWAAHGRRESHLTLREIHRVCGTVIPGARVRRHLLWRYSIIWTK